MDSTRWGLYLHALAGPALAFLVSVLILTRARILARIRGASWVAVLLWCLLGLLPWILPAPRIPLVMFVAPPWPTRAAIAATTVLVPFVAFALPFLALGASAIWCASRLSHILGRGMGARGA